MSIGGNLIVAPGVVGPVTLTNVAIGGDILNFSGVELQVQVPEVPEQPENPDNPDETQKPETPSDYPWVQADGYVNYDNYNVPVYNSVAVSYTHLVEAARAFARDHGCVLVLKGHRTVTASPYGNVLANTSG